jgi:1-acyl-sn-glycerol-3-phosphate acyltransferase
MIGPNSKHRVYTNEQDSSLIPTLAVSLWLGWMGVLTYTVIFAATLATTFQRNVIISILAISFILPPAFPGKLLGDRIGLWIMKGAEKYFGLKVTIENEAAFHKLNEEGKTAIFAIEPHDFLPFGIFAFKSGLGYLPGKIGETSKTLMTSSVFNLPIIKHVSTWVGGLPVDKKTFRSRLANNECVAFCPGGVQEVILIDRNNKDDLILFLQSRKGFIKLALESGTAIVPTFIFNQDHSFGYVIPRGKFVTKVGRQIGILPVFFWGRFCIPFGIPNPVQISVVIGEPFDVPCEGTNISNESVDKYHKIFLQKTEELFERHKHTEGYGHRQLKIM